MTRKTSDLAQTVWLNVDCLPSFSNVHHILRRHAPLPSRNPNLVRTRMHRLALSNTLATAAALVSKQMTRAFSCSTIKKIATEDAPAAVGPYSQAISTGGFVYVSGQLPLDPKTMKFNSNDDVALQARQCLDNMKAILKEANSGMDKVVKTTVLLADIADFQKVNAVYAEYFKPPYPARACYAVKSLPMGALVEIEAVARTNDTHNH